MDRVAAALLTGHLVATAAMAGLIWTIQIVHYPLFAEVGRDAFVRYEHLHRMRISFVVGPLMGAESLLALTVLGLRPAGLSWTWPLIGVLLLGLIHLSTIAVQVPLHMRLSAGFDPATARRLVRTNWIRTVGWSARAVVAAIIVVEAGT